MFSLSLFAPAVSSNRAIRMRVPPNFSTSGNSQEIPEKWQFCNEHVAFSPAAELYSLPLFITLTANTVRSNAFIYIIYLEAMSRR